VRLRSLALALVVCGVTAPAATAGENPWIVRKPLNVAHQGGEDQFPSNTMFAFRKAVAAGADMLELDVGATRDGAIIVMHDTTVDGKTNGHGTVASKSLRQIKRLDAAYWFSKRGPDHYEHGRRRSAYPLRGIVTGRRPPPRGFRGADFRVPTLGQVLRAFPAMPVNIEIKGRTRREKTPEYVRNAERLAHALRRTRRRDLIVTSFRQAAVDRFHELLPRIDLAPGIGGAASYLLAGGSPGAGVAAFQLPITYQLGGTLLEITTPKNVARAHGDDYAWHTWFSDDDRDAPATWRRLIDDCVAGIMTGRPLALERVMRSHPRPTPCR